jgi:acyl-CoA thioesterase FadM
MRMASAIFHNGKGLAHAETVSVLIENKTRKPVEIPAELRKVLAAYSET